MDPAEQMYLVSYGPNENCTLALCPVQRSVYGYRPNLPANISFIVLFFISLLIHIYQGIHYRTWFFLGATILGCVAEILGYGFRVMLWVNPFSFTGFLANMLCITIGPVFYAAGIYVTLTKVVNYLEPSISWFRPKLYYWIFIPCDIVSLVFQAAGGSMSSNSSGTSQTGVNVTLVGLSFQVFTLVIFAIFCADYGVRYYKFHRQSSTKREMSGNFTLFVVFMSLAFILILIRCAYRIEELSNGYRGESIRKEAPFIGLESAMIVVATFALNVGHPGPAFESKMKSERMTSSEAALASRQAKKEKTLGSESDTPSATDSV